MLQNEKDSNRSIRKNQDSIGYKAGIFLYGVDFLNLDTFYAIRAQA